MPFKWSARVENPRKCPSWDPSKTSTASARWRSKSALCTLRAETEEEYFGRIVLELCSNLSRLLEQISPVRVGRLYQVLASTESHTRRTARLLSPHKSAPSQLRLLKANSIHASPSFRHHGPPKCGGFIAFSDIKLLDMTLVRASTSCRVCSSRTKEHERSPPIDRPAKMRRLLIQDRFGSIWQWWFRISGRNENEDDQKG